MPAGGRIEQFSNRKLGDVPDLIEDETPDVSG